MSDDRGQKTDDRSQRTEVRWQIRIFGSACRIRALNVQMGHLTSVLCFLSSGH